MTAYQTLTTEVSDGIMTLTLNRPDRLNAFTVGMMQEMVAVLDMADADDSVRAVIVTGAGRGFCPGVDLDDPDAFTGMIRPTEIWAGCWRCACSPVSSLSSRR